jgi:hypothetical protein
MNKPNFDWYNHDDLIRAVIVVFDRFADEAKKPGADSWITDTRRDRPRMVADVTEQWRSIAEVSPDEMFPYHDDYVCRVWAAYRRRPESEKANARYHYFRTSEPML